MQDLNAHGVTGNATLASAEKGEAMLEMAVQGLETLVGEMHQFELARIDCDALGQHS